MTELITMSANAGKSVTIQINAPGRHPLREAAGRAAAILILLGISAIMGYRLSDAVREPSPALCGSLPEARLMIPRLYCGTVPDGVDRAGILFHCTRDPAQPASNGKRKGYADTRSIAAAVMRNAALVDW